MPAFVQCENNYMHNNDFFFHLLLLKNLGKIEKFNKKCFICASLVLRISREDSLDSLKHFFLKKENRATFCNIKICFCVK